MSILQAALLGVIQGLTEFIPVSSSGHLIIGEYLFGLSTDNFSFDVSIHLGTLLALLIYFRSDIFNILRRWQKNRSLLRHLLIATLPGVVLGVLAQNFIEENTRSILLVCLNLALVGLAMVLVDRIVKRNNRSDIDNSSALSLGLAQSLALIPGVSRSGITILTGRMLGYDYQTITRFSFLMAIPITLGATSKVILSDSGISLWQQDPSVALTGCLMAALGGMVAIKFMLDKIQHMGLRWFGFYRLGLAALLSLLVINGVI